MQTGRFRGSERLLENVTFHTDKITWGRDRLVRSQVIGKPASRNI